VAIDVGEREGIITTSFQFNGLRADRAERQGEEKILAARPEIVTVHANG
jgi:hypothetical protein